MKIIGISGSIVGSKTRIAVEYALKTIKERFTDIEVELVDLGDYELVFADGRNHRDYSGDTKTVIEKILSGDGFIIGSPVFQASIPGALKNLFDLLPLDAFRGKVVGLVLTAGTPKHYLVVEQQLKPILSYMKAITVPKYVFIEEKHYQLKSLTDDDILFRLNKLSENVVLSIKAIDIVKGVNVSPS